MPDDKPGEPIGFDPATDRKLILQSKRMDLEAGWIGRIIGSAKNAPNNIAFLVVMLVLVAGVVVSFVFPSDRVEFWKTILPIVTLTLGYVFGKSSN